MSQPQMHFALALHLFAFTDGLSVCGSLFTCTFADNGKSNSRILALSEFGDRLLL